MFKKTADAKNLYDLLKVDKTSFPYEKLATITSRHLFEWKDF